jgi:hypothetical protein
MLVSGTARFKATSEKKLKLSHTKVAKRLVLSRTGNCFAKSKEMQS